MDTNCGIYLITNLEDGKVYPGSSRRLHKCKTSMGREYEHFQMLKNGRHSNRHLQSAYNLYGREAFQWEVLMYLPDDISEKDLQYWEDYYMRVFDALNPNYGYNFLSADRREISEETRAKLSASLKGHPVAEETKKKIVEVRNRNGSYKVSQGVKEYFSRLYKGQTIPNRYQAQKGHKWSEESLRKRSISKSKDYRVVSPDGDEFEVRNLKKFCEEKGLGYKGMNNISRGLGKVYKGWKCDARN